MADGASPLTRHLVNSRIRSRLVPPIGLQHRGAPPGASPSWWWWGGRAVNQAEPACPARAHTDTQQVTQSWKTAIPCGTASPRADLLAPRLEKARLGQNPSALWVGPSCYGLRKMHPTWTSQVPKFVQFTEAYLALGSCPSVRCRGHPAVFQGWEESKLLWEGTKDLLAVNLGE